MQPITGCSGKLCFFTILCNPSLAYIAVRDFQSSNAMRVYSHSYWLVIFVQPIAAECWRGRGGKLSRILGKNTIFTEHPVRHTFLSVSQRQGRALSVLPPDVVGGRPYWPRSISQSHAGTGCSEIIPR